MYPFLSFGGLGYPRLRLIVGNDELPASEYSRTGRNGYPRLLVGELTGLLRSGAMLADALEQLHEPVSDLCGALERVLRTAVQADLCASWSDQGLRLPAWNDHDTLLLQVEGIRLWRLFQPTTYHPTGNSNPPKPFGEPRWEGRVAPGNLLYIPRGWWFCDTSIESPAIYMALTFKPLRGVDILWRLFERASTIDLMRMDVPYLGTQDAQNAYIMWFQKELRELMARPGLLLGPKKHFEESSEPRTVFNLPWSAAAAPLPLTPEHRLVALLRFGDGVWLWRKHRGDASRYATTVYLFA